MGGDVGPVGVDMGDFDGLRRALMAGRVGEGCGLAGLARAGSFLVELAGVVGVLDGLGPKGAVLALEMLKVSLALELAQGSAFHWSSRAYGSDTLTICIGRCR